MKKRILPMLRISSAIVAVVLAAVPTEAFTSTSLLEPRTSTSTGRSQQPNHGFSPIIQPRQSPRQSTTSLNVLGQEGILGVGAPEIAVTLLVGYFVLGPSDLYKLVKEVGKFIQNFRTLGAETAKAFEGTMEDQLELTELRKAQAELSDAFSFRRSINTDELNEAFDKTSFSENTAVAAAVAGTEVAGKEGTKDEGIATASDGSTMTVEEGSAMPKKKRRLVRRKKKKAVEEIDVPLAEGEEDFAMEYPDLDMLDADFPLPARDDDDVSGEVSEEEKLRAERLERLTGSSKESEPDWFTASEEDIASEVLNGGQPAIEDPALEAYQKQRFQSQVSPEEWNAQIMANEDKLAPLSMVMQRLAILEDEKNAADKRIEEEYERRMDNEDKYYLEKRKVLEGAITDIQEEVYGIQGDGEKEVEVESGASKFSA